MATCQGASTGLLGHLLRDYIFWACAGLHGPLGKPHRQCRDPQRRTVSGKQTPSRLKFIVCQFHPEFGRKLLIILFIYPAFQQRCESWLSPRSVVRFQYLRKEWPMPETPLGPTRFPLRCISEYPGSHLGPDLLCGHDPVPTLRGNMISRVAAWLSSLHTNRDDDTLSIQEAHSSSGAINIC